VGGERGSGGGGADISGDRPSKQAGAKQTFRFPKPLRRHKKKMNGIPLLTGNPPSRRVHSAFEELHGETERREQKGSGVNEREGE